MISFRIRPLYLRYPLDRRLGEPQSQSGGYGKENILDPTGTWTPDINLKSVSSRYTDYAIPALQAQQGDRKYCRRRPVSGDQNICSGQALMRLRS
jgi:hypothetical protein